MRIVMAYVKSHMPNTNDIVKYTLKSVFLIVTIILCSCNHTKESREKDQQRIASETFALMENYKMLELHKDSLDVMDLPMTLLGYQCAAEILKETKSDLSVEELSAQARANTTRWRKNELPGTTLLIYDEKTHTARWPNGESVGYKKGCFVFSRPIFLNDFKYAVMQSAYYCGPLCGESEVILFKKMGARWIKLKSYCEMIS